MRSTELPDGSFFLTGGECRGETVNNAYHFMNGNMTKLNVMYNPRKAHTSVYVEGSVYVFGGFYDKLILNYCEKYDMNTRSWKQLSNMIYSKAYSTPLVYGTNYIFLIGGFGDKKCGIVITFKIVIRTG
jgi:hypothetical protein